jgi:DNA-binding transcriptional LysR family regulator
MTGGRLPACGAACHAVQYLFRLLGVDLFLRDEGRLRLCAAGMEFLPVARSLVAQAETALDIAAAIAAGRLQHVTIAAPGTTLTDVVAPFLATLEADDPMPAVLEETPASVYATLALGADLAIGTTPPPHQFEGLTLAELPVWAYVPPTDDWAGRGHVPLAELVERPLLTQNRDFHPRRALDGAMATARLGYTELHEFGSPEVAQAVAASGRGIAVVSDDPRFDLRPLGIDGPTGPVGISLYAAWRPDHHGAATLGRLAARLAAFCVARYGEQVTPSRRRTRRQTPVP